MPTLIETIENLIAQNGGKQVLAKEVEREWGKTQYHCNKNGCYYCEYLKQKNHGAKRPGA